MGCYGTKNYILTDLDDIDIILASFALDKKGNRLGMEKDIYKFLTSSKSLKIGWYSKISFMIPFHTKIMM